MENGKEPERGSYHALPAKPKGAGQGRVVQGRWDESVPLLCSALSGCQAGVLELSACRGYRLCGVVYGYN